MQMVVIAITALIIAYTFDMELLAAALAAAIFWSVLWPATSRPSNNQTDLPGHLR